jgi:hypothetical protein
MPIKNKRTTSNGYMQKNITPNTVDTVMETD